MNHVFRDPAVKNEDSFRVLFNRGLTSPSFNCFGAALTYLQMLERGERAPEWSVPPTGGHVQYEYAGFIYDITLDPDGEILSLKPIAGQHASASKSKHCLAAMT